MELLFDFFADVGVLDADPVKRRFDDFEFSCQPHAFFEGFFDGDKRFVACQQQTVGIEG